MRESLQVMTFRNIAMFNMIIIITLLLLDKASSYFLILSVAQFVFIPFMLHLICKNDQSRISSWLVYLSIPAFIALFMIHIVKGTVPEMIPFLLSCIYFLFTLIVAIYGVSRFLKRGFVHFEEFLIDMGLICLAIGGAWYVAYEGNINTGFSPIITWLTSIHFHYSAFLLLLFTGFIGRLHKPRGYHLIGMSVLVAPFIVAIGITFSVYLELVSVILYMFSIYGLIFLSFKTSFQHTIQQWMIRISFSALGVSILFSFLYAFGNVTGIFSITIDFMLRSHGITNMVFFALIGMIGWALKLPPSHQQKLQFPISTIRGKWINDERILKGKTTKKKYVGLVDQLSNYVPNNSPTLSPTIVDFYENTNQYRLFANVNWHFGFLPFALIYRLISSKTKQINLPLSRKKVEMTGDIVAIKDKLDGRDKTRAWIRKIDGETTFVALYSSHQTKNRTYMNIALPLPWTSMIGILELSQIGQNLRLSSKNKQCSHADSGIYLVIKDSLFKLPIEEQFDVSEVANGNLEARHVMWIFSIPFLTIHYTIYHESAYTG